MENNINKYLNDIGLNLIIYYIVPNTHTAEQYDFLALNSNNQKVTGSIFFSFTQIDIEYKTIEKVNHLYSCVIKHSSINNYIIHTTHSIISDNTEKIIDAMTLENIPQKEFFNFHLSDDIVSQKSKVLVNS